MVSFSCFNDEVLSVYGPIEDPVPFPILKRPFLNGFISFSLDSHLEGGSKERMREEGDVGLIWNALTHRHIRCFTSLNCFLIVLLLCSFSREVTFTIWEWSTFCRSPIKGGEEVFLLLVLKGSSLVSPSNYQLILPLIKPPLVHSRAWVLRWKSLEPFSIHRTARNEVERDLDGI